jgi:hypothetical protein
MTTSKLRVGIFGVLPMADQAKMAGVPDVG